MIKVRFMSFISPNVITYDFYGVDEVDLIVWAEHITQATSVSELNSFSIISM